jgi:hypothetical protein
MPAQIQIDPLCQIQSSSELRTTQTGQSAIPESESSTADLHMTTEKIVEESQGKKHAEVSCHVSNSDETKHTGGALQELDNESLKTTAAEDSSVMSEIHYPEASDHLITSADLHNQSSTVAHQTVNNLDLISATVVDTSNDASLVQMTKQDNMVMNCVPDPSQMVETRFDTASHDLNTIDEPIHDEKLQLKQVENQHESSVIRTSEDMVLCEQTDDEQHETNSNTTPDTQTRSGAIQDLNHQSNSGAASSRSNQDIDWHMTALQIEPSSDTWKEVPTLTNWKSEVFNSHQLRNYVNSSLNRRWREPFLDYDKAVVFKLQFKSH